ncbi:pyruvate dehydrogenase E2 component (dihydrolipoamide acetyltransferase) [Paenibacillus shirakamiensis]|uniref:Pyruvate dehydrogenase E2 component (Dihydrolipoamide acetyltransferase) n=1 Tax=Paenibacillus shirakamiensis TaxID=1265935 RepID=A0ABS4JD55_9BACL|nr:2-oxo acid dehydrogenase subunit E2 [Paenibacillus shirakamiensis]MBP1999653.1 pyruvate dehydrogenase E2 component (dihydrolipoamide acetyltransferase) [Paenibacillus shirakamiensis]
MSINNNEVRHEVFDAQRKLVAHMTSKSWKEVPHVSYVYEPDITNFYSEYKKLNKEVKITFNTIMLKTIAEGLVAAPELNAHLEYNDTTREGRLIYHDHIHASVPWQMSNGSMVPLIIRNTNELSLVDIAQYTLRLDEKVKNTDMLKLIRFVTGQASQADQLQTLEHAVTLTKEDIVGGTVTISNIGSLYREQKGHLVLLDIIPPEIFVVGIGAVQDKPGVYVDGQGEQKIGIRKVLSLCLAFDHRAVDFSSLVPFLKKLDDIFANPHIIHEW